MAQKKKTAPKKPLRKPARNKKAVPARTKAKAGSRVASAKPKPKPAAKKSKAIGKGRAAVKKPSKAKQPLKAAAKKPLRTAKPAAKRGSVPPAKTKRIAPISKKAAAAAKGRNPSAKGLPPPPRPAAADQRPKAKPSQTAPPPPAPVPAAIAPKPAPGRPAAQARPSERRPAKERVVMEFQVNSAPNVLYELISTPSGFSEWYCDDVNVRGDQYVFIWNGEEEAVTLIGRKAPEVIRFHRNDDDDQAAFFELRIRIDAMTNEVALIVTDHAWPNEVEATRNLWTSQVANLVRVLGA